MGQSKINTLHSYINRIKDNLMFNRTMLIRSALVTEEYGLISWFRKGPSKRLYHSDAVKAIKRIMPAESVILETGCGIGQTFVMLSKHGFNNFIGIEKDPSVFKAAKKFLSLYGIEARLFNDDGLNTFNWVRYESVDVYLPLNWTFETNEQEKIFDIGWKVLRPGGLMIIDIIRNDFVPNSKKEKIVYERYPHKYSLEEVRSLAVKKNFKILALDEKYGCRFNIYLRKSIQENAHRCA